MKAKVRLSSAVRTMDVISEVEIGDSGKYEFHWWYLSPAQKSRVKRQFGKMYALYTKAEIIKLYKDKN